MFEVSYFSSHFSIQSFYFEVKSKLGSKSSQSYKFNFQEILETQLMYIADIFSVHRSAIIAEKYLDGEHLHKQYSADNFGLLY